MSPFVGFAGTIAAFATTVAVGLFRVDTPGWGSLLGQTVRKFSACPAGYGTAVTLNEYASGCCGRFPRHGLLRIGSVRVSIALSDGGPSPGGSVDPTRVSTTRQGVRG